MTKNEVNDDTIVEENEVRNEDDVLELDIVFEPDNELDLSQNSDEEVREEKEEQLEMRDAVFPIEFKRDDTDSRTINMSISSESPVMRNFGLEVLSHRSEDINLERLNNKAPLLLNHDANVQIGVIENTNLDESRGRLNASVRFGKSTLAQEVYDDIIDGIRSQVSIGYSIDQLDKVETDDYDDDVYRASFTPHEVSIVSMAADQTVGIGRSLSFKKLSNTEVDMTQEDNTKETVNVDEQIRVATTDAVKKRDKEISDIYALASRHNKSQLADKAVAAGSSIDEFRSVLLTEIENKPLESQEIGLNEKEARDFSIIKAAKAIAGLIDKDEAAFELEASREYGKKIGREAKGFFIPEDVANKWSERTMTTVNQAAVVYDDKQYNNMVDALTAWSTILQASPTVIGGLTGNVTIPRVSALSTSAWVTEGVAVGSSDLTSDTITLSEKTTGCYSDLTRSLLNNTDGLSAESLTRNNLLRAMGVAWDLASVAGSGAAGQPRGIENVVGVNATAFGVAGAPTYAELIAMESAIFADNAALDSNSVRWITTPALNGYAKTLATNGAGSPVAQRDGFIDGRPVLVSSQVTANNVILGDFSEFIVGTWGSLEVNVDPYALSTSGGLRLVALSSVDFGVKHPVSFCVSA